MQQEHEATTKPIIEKIRRKHAELSNMLLRVMTKLECKRALGLPLQTQEIDFRRKLESLKRKLAKPAQYQARVSELQSIVHMQDDRVSSDSLSYKLDSETQAKLHEVLDFQRRGLLHLTSVLNKDSQDVELMSYHGEKDSHTATRVRYDL